MKKNYIFYLDDRKSVENEEIKKVIGESGFSYEIYNRTKLNLDTFWDMICNRIFQEEITPVLIGWSAYIAPKAKPYIWNNDHLEYADYQTVLIRADNSLLLQVLDFLELKPTQGQKLKALFHRKSLNELSADYTFQELNAYAEWETFWKTSDKEFSQIINDIRNAQKIGSLWFADLVSKNGETLAVTDAVLCYAPDYDLFLTFRDATSPKFIGNPKVVKKLAGKFGGIFAKNNRYWWGSGADPEEIKKFIFSIYTENEV